MRACLAALVPIRYYLLIHRGRAAPKELDLAVEHLVFGLDYCQLQRSLGDERHVVKLRFINIPGFFKIYVIHTS